MNSTATTIMLVCLDSLQTKKCAKESVAFPVPTERRVWLLCRQWNGRFSYFKDNQRSSKATCCELSLHAKVCAHPPKCFIINTGLCRYKGSEPRKCL